MNKRDLLKTILAAAAMPSIAFANDQDSPRILFTGFKPWSDSPDTNISEDMLRAFQPELEELGVELKFLNVSYRAIDEFLETLNTDEYDYIVNFGVDLRENARAITVEMMASNRRYYPDDTGYCPLRLTHSHGGCVNDGRDDKQPGETMISSPMLLDLMHAPRFSSLDIQREGLSPQEYLCAYLFYHTTEKIDPRLTENTFVHLGWKDTGEQAEFILGLANEIVSAHALRLHLGWINKNKRDHIII